MDIKIGLVDDHKLFRRGLSELIGQLNTCYQVVFEVGNGNEMQEILAAEDYRNRLPDVMVMDIRMPEMDGYESVQWLNVHHPTIQVLVVSMLEAEEHIVGMVRQGVKGYLSKDVEPQVLNQALLEVSKGHFYYTDFLTGKLVHAIRHQSDLSIRNGYGKLKDKEVEFLKLACTEMTYQQIAEQMFVSPKTVDGYRKVLFEKLKIKNRVGLAMFAVREGLVKV